MKEKSLVVSAAANTPPSHTPLSDTADNGMLRQLQHELAYTKQALQDTIEELTTANAELQAANEELITTNKELRDTNDKLNVARQETELANNTLMHVNAQLQGKVEELAQANHDINSLLHSSDIPTLILDRELSIKWFTPAAQELFDIPSEKARQLLSRINHHLLFDDLTGEIRRFFHTGQAQEFEVQADDGEWYIMRLRPYYKVVPNLIENFVSGVVLTFANVSSIRQAAAALEWQYGQLTVLYRTVEIFGRTLDIEAIYAAAMQGLTDALKVDRVSILVLDEAKVMRFRAWRGISDAYRQVAEGHSPWSPDETNPQPVLVPDVTVDPTLDALQPLFQSEGIGALGFIPLQFQGQLIGKFMLYYNQPHTFIYEEVQLAQTLATHVAFALERGRARNALREAHDSLEEQVEQRTAQLMEQIDHRLETERALQKSQAFLQDAQRIAQVGSWEMDMHSRQVIWSDELYRIYGVDPQQFIPTFEAAMARTHPDDIPDSRERWQRFMSEKTTHESHSRIIRPDGDIRYVHNRTYMTLNEAGEPRRLFGTIQDETERKLAEAHIVRKADQLAALNAMGQMVVSSLELNTVLERILSKLRGLLRAEGIFILLRQGGQSFQFAAVSGEGFEQLTGLEVPTDAGIAGEVMHTHRATLVQGQEAVAQRTYRHIKQLTDHPIGVLLAVPMLLKTELMGVLEAIHSREDAFSADNLAMLEAAAAWTSIAIGNARLYEKIHHNEERLRQLTDQLVAAQEEERQRISRELHDEAGQSLTVLKLNLAMITADLADHPLSKQLRDAGDLVADTMQRLRLLAYDLRPPEIDIVGLNASLRDLCENFSQRVRLEVHFTATNIQPQVPDAVHLSLYRCLQEALTNVAKHAQASRVEVRLEQQDEMITLSVWDNGNGFDPAQQLTRGLGLLGMKERIERLGGSLTITSEVNKGTTLTASVAL